MQFNSSDLNIQNIQSTKDNLITLTLNFAESLIGTSYEYWNIDTQIGDHGPMWVGNSSTIPSLESILKSTICCTGLINLIEDLIN